MDKYTSVTQNYIERTEQSLYAYLPKADNGQDIVCDAMEYSVKNGGKRVRPLLTLEFCRLCGGDTEQALPFACALEMIHTYSLIHDDLPCMDNDDMRRGKPSCHIKFGEEYALLAGDGLLNRAFEVVAEFGLKGDNLGGKINAFKTLSSLSGIFGMIGGQTIDLQSENKSVDLETLKVMDRLKTGALIKAACVMGCQIADADETKVEAARVFAENIGIAFQIIDDILDVTGDAAVLGKPVGSDSENEKSTYVSLLGLEKAKKYAEELTNKAIEALDVFGSDADYLKAFALSLCERKK